MKRLLLSSLIYSLLFSIAAGCRTETVTDTAIDSTTTAAEQKADTKTKPSTDSDYGQAGYFTDSGQKTNLKTKPSSVRFIRLEDLDLGKIRSEGTTPKKGKTFMDEPIRLGGKTYEHGVGTHARSNLGVDLKGAATQFVATVGCTYYLSGSVSFEVWLDGRKVADSGVIKSQQPPKTISIDLTDAQKMILKVTNGGDFRGNDHAVWADARIFLAPGTVERPETIQLPPLPPASSPPVGLELEPLPVIAPVDTSPEPAIHGPRVVGTTPGRPFMFLVPATGKKPLVFSARNLPEGLELNEKTGIISGSLKQEGKTVVELTVKGPKGVARRNLTIVGGEHKLALTPPMGWNSWYVWGTNVTEQHIRDAADMLVETGLAARGYQYVDIDAGWEGQHGVDGRDANGCVLPNKKFPDMKALSDYVHSKGLKFGIYSSPGPTTCCGEWEGSYNYELQDAITYAEWGVDFLKYDLCSYFEGNSWKNSGQSIEDQMKPIVVMREALDKCGRDIVYHFGGWPEVWQWGQQAGLNQWRIAYDIIPKWTDVKQVMLTQRGAEAYACPGYWNDPDYLMVGNSWFSQNQPSMLTGNEQLFQVTHWALSAAPLFVSCNLAQLDDFTLALLSNDEVIDVDQDPLGIQARPVYQCGDAEILARPLCDGTKAVGLFNWCEEPTEITIRWEDLRIKGPQPVRDLWQRKDLGIRKDSFTATVGRHGAVLIKVGKPTAPDAP